MTKLRQLWLLTALAAVAVLAGGYFLLVSPKSTQASTLRGEAQQQRTTNQGLQAQIDQLNKQKKDLPKQQQLLAEFAGKIPGNPALPALIRALSDAADNAGVDLVSVTPAAPVYAKPETGGQSAGVPAPNNTVLVTIPVGVQVVGHYSNLTQFFNEIENLRRAMVVSGLDISRGAVTSATEVDADLLKAIVTTNVLMTAKAPAVAAPVAPPTDAK